MLLFLVQFTHVLSSLLFGSKDPLIDPGRILWPKSTWTNHPLEFSLNHAGELITATISFSASTRLTNGIVEIHFPLDFDLTTSIYYYQPGILVLPLNTSDPSSTTVLNLGQITLPLSPGSYGPIALFTRQSLSAQVIDMNKVFCTVGVLEAALPPPSDSLGVSFFDINMDKVSSKSTLSFTFTLTKDLWKYDTFVIAMPSYFSVLNPVCRSEDVSQNPNYLKTSALDSHEFGCIFKDGKIFFYGLLNDIDVKFISNSQSLVVCLSVTGFTNPVADFNESLYEWDLNIYRHSTGVIVQSFHGTGPSTSPGIVFISSWQPTGSYSQSKIVPNLRLYMDLVFTADHYIPAGGSFLIQFSGVDIQSSVWQSDCSQGQGSGSQGFYYIDPYIGGSCIVTQTSVQCSGFKSDIYARNTLTVTLLVKFVSSSASVQSISTYYNSNTVIDQSAAPVSIAYASGVQLASSFTFMFTNSLLTTSANRVCNTGGGLYYLVIYLQLPVALSSSNLLTVLFPASLTAATDYSVNIGTALTGVYKTGAALQTDLTSGTTQISSITLSTSGVTFAVTSPANYFISIALFKNDGAGLPAQLNLPYIGSNYWTRYESRVELVVSNVLYTYSTPFTILPSVPSMSFDLLCTDSGKAGLPARITGSPNFAYNSLYYLYIDIKITGSVASDLGSNLNNGDSYPFSVDASSAIPSRATMVLNTGVSPILTISGITSVQTTSVLTAYFPLGSLTGSYSVGISIYTLKTGRPDIKFQVFSFTTTVNTAANTKNWQQASSSVATAQVGQLITGSGSGLGLSLRSTSGTTPTLGYIGLILPQGFTISLPTITSGSNSLSNILYFSSKNINFAFPGLMAQETSLLSLSAASPTTLSITGITAASYFSYSTPGVTLQPYEAGSWNSPCQSITGSLPTLTLTRGVLSPKITPTTVIGRGPGSLQQSITAIFSTLTAIPSGSYIEIGINSAWAVSTNTVFTVTGLSSYQVTSSIPFQISGFSALSPASALNITISNLIPPVNPGGTNFKTGCLDYISIYAGSSNKLISSWSDNTDSAVPASCVTVMPQNSAGVPSYKNVQSFPNTLATNGVSVFLNFSLQNMLPIGSNIIIKSPTSNWAISGDIKDMCWFSLKYSSCSASGNSLIIVTGENYQGGSLSLLVDQGLNMPNNLQSGLSFTISSSFFGVSIDKDVDVGVNQTLNLVSPPAQIFTNNWVGAIPNNAGELATYQFKFSISCGIAKGDQLWINFPNTFDAFLGASSVKFTWGESNNYYINCASKVLGDIVCKTDHWFLVVSNLATVPAQTFIELDVYLIANPATVSQLPSFKLYLVDASANIKAMKTDFSGGNIVTPPLSNIIIREIKSSSSYLQALSDYTFTFYMHSLTFALNDLLIFTFPKQYLLDWDLDASSVFCSSQFIDETLTAVSRSSQMWDLTTNCSYNGSNMISMNISQTGSWTSSDRISITLYGLPNPEWGFSRSSYFEGQGSEFFPDLTDWTSQFQVSAFQNTSQSYLGKSYGNLNPSFLGFASSGMRISIGNYDPTYSDQHILIVPGTQSAALPIRVNETWGLMAEKLVLYPKNHLKNKNSLYFSSYIFNFTILIGQKGISFQLSAEVGSVNALGYIQWGVDEYSLIGLTQTAYSVPCKTLVEVYSMKTYQLTAADSITISIPQESSPIQISSPVSPASNFTLLLSFEDATLNGVEISPISLTFLNGTTEMYFKIKISESFNGKTGVPYNIKFGITGPDSATFLPPSFYFTAGNISTSNSSLIDFTIQDITRTSAGIYVTSNITSVVYWQLLPFGTQPLSFQQLLDLAKPLVLANYSGQSLEDQHRLFHASIETSPGVNETWEDFQRRLYVNHLTKIWYSASYIEAGTTILVSRPDWLWAETNYSISGYVLEDSGTLYNSTFLTNPLPESALLQLLFTGLVVESKSYPLSTIVAYTLGVPQKQISTLSVTGSRHLSSNTLFSWVFYPNRAWDFSPLDLYLQADQDQLGVSISKSGILNTIISFSGEEILRSQYQSPYWTNSGYPSLLNITNSSVSVSLKSAVSGSVCCVVSQSNISTNPSTPNQVLLLLAPNNLNTTGLCIENIDSSFDNQIILIGNLTANTNYTATCCAFNTYPIWPSSSPYAFGVFLPSFLFTTLITNVTNATISYSLVLFPILALINFI